MKTKFSFNSICERILSLTARLASPVTSQTPLPSVDINNATSPGNTQTNFDALVAPSGGFTTLSGTFGGVTISIAGVGESLDSAVRAMPTNSLATNSMRLTTAALYQDFVFGGYTNGNGLSVLLSGLTPYQNYTVKILSFDALSTGARGSDCTANLPLRSYT